jgi:DNA-binding MarR family transcriptional regulator
VALVDDLESQGLVVRATDPDDRRSKVVEATELGAQRLAEARLAVATATERTFASLTSEEREALAQLLQRVAFDD